MKNCGALTELQLEAAIVAVSQGGQVIIHRQALEQYQVFVYLGAILAGLAVGLAMPGIAPVLQWLIWPVLGLLLYATFTQTPLRHLGQAFVDSRFLTAAVIGNFAVLPILVFGLLAYAPSDPAVRLGIALVLLAPCTDWFITFTQLGDGDAQRAIAFSPISLLLQILLLPFYILVLIGDSVTVAFATHEAILVFLGLIVTPLTLAYFTQCWAESRKNEGLWLERLAWFPVPLLAAVVFMIAASQIGAVMASVSILSHLLIIFSAFLAAAGLIARSIATLFSLPPRQGRALAFSFGTRNSFVVLPLALALPASWEIAAVVIVFQSLVELFGMAVYLWWAPKILFPMQK